MYGMREQFIRYFVTGCSAVLIDIGCLWLFKEKFGVSPRWALAIYQVFLINYVFLMNKYWSFKSKGTPRDQIIRFYVVALLNYVIGIGWIWFWHDRQGINAYAARVANIACAVGWNFFLYKYWVYATSSLQSTPSDPREVPVYNTNNPNP